MSNTLHIKIIEAHDKWDKVGELIEMPKDTAHSLLLKGVAKVVTPNDLKQSKKELWEKAIDTKPPQQENNIFFNVSNKLKKGVPELNWTIKNILPEKGICMIGAPPKSYKTFLAMQMAIDVSNGEPFLGVFETIKGNALYIDEENGLRTLLNRFNQLNKNEETYRNVYSACVTGMLLDGKENEEVNIHIFNLRNFIEANNIKVVVLDSLVRFMQGDEDRSTDVRRLFKNIKPLVEECGCSFIILHHFRKSNGNKRNMDSLRGSSDFAAMVDTIIHVKPRNLAPVVDVEWLANRHVDMHSLKQFTVGVESYNGSLAFKYYGESDLIYDKTHQLVSITTDWFLDDQVVEFRRSQLVEYLKKHGVNSEKEVQNVLDFLMDEGVLEHEPRKPYYVKGDKLGRLKSYLDDKKLSPQGDEGGEMSIYSGKGEEDSKSSPFLPLLYRGRRNEGEDVSGIYKEVFEETFSELDQDYQGTCAMCGRSNMWIRWKDEKGHHICEKCYVEEQNEN